MDAPHADHDAVAAPATRTFLFTDLEGSTRLWELAPAAMCDALAAHDALARRLVAANGGAVVKSSGDGVHAVFADAAAALAAVLAFQRGLAALADAHALPLRARCGLHAGACEQRDGDYFGGVVNRAARIMSAGSGGQMLLSQAVVDATRERLPPGARVVDLGLARLRDLARPERLYQLEHPDLPAVFPPLRSLDATPNNLPLQLTSFLGREDDVARVRALLADGRLVTVTGPGGIGKTRLALQVAADTVDRYADGAWFVDLAPLADPDEVAATVAQVLGVREETTAAVDTALARHLAARHVLIVLDNCEHVLGACVTLAGALLAAAPGLVVLATTRESLHIPGERVWPLAPLPLPAADDPAADLAPAVRLFVERARDTRPDFAPGPSDLETIAGICRRVDGIPLAIELAAARTRALTVAEIGRRLADRFALLAGGHRAALPRQRTLDALIGWSYDLLEGGERDLFVRLSVFAGGFELDAAAEVCAAAGDAVATIDVVEALVAKSLLVAYERGAAMRFRMLDTIRAFARDRLIAVDPAGALQDRHVAWCVALAQAGHDALRGAQQAEWIERLDAEADNLRAALAWATVRPPSHAAALTIAAKLWRYWHLNGRMTEGRALVARALAATAHDPALPARADALYAAGALAKNQSDLTEAARHLDAAYAAFHAQGRERDAAAALGSLGNVRQDLGDLATARALHARAHELFCRVGDRAAEATALLNLGSICVDLGEWDAALQYHERSLALARELGLGTVECMGESNLGGLALDRDDAPTARRHFERALALARRIHFRVVEATALASLAAIALAGGDRGAARPLARDAIAILAEAGSKATLIEALETAAELCARDGATLTAARVLAATAAARGELALPLLPRARRTRERVQALVDAAPLPLPVPELAFADAAGATLAELNSRRWPNADAGG